MVWVFGVIIFGATKEHSSCQGEQTPFPPWFSCQEYLSTSHFMTLSGWWTLVTNVFFQWLLCIRLKRFRPAVVFCRWPLDNQKVLTVFAIFWKFWCLISAKLENKCWPLPNNLLRDYLFRNSHRMQYSFHQYTKQSQVIIKLVADCIKTRIC